MTGYTVTFKPWRGHGRMALWRFREIRRWARRHGHYFSGTLRYVKIRY